MEPRIVDQLLQHHTNSQSLAQARFNNRVEVAWALYALASRFSLAPLADR